MMKVCALVVWYNPVPEYVRVIENYLNCLDYVVVVDNSNADNSFLLKDVLAGVNYNSLGQNLGLAAGLNIGLKIAAQYAVDYVLTMDQDSSFAQSQIRDLILKASSLFEDDRVAIVAPCPLSQVSGGCGSAINDVVDCQSLVTSGNLVRLEALEQVGGFEEDFFIDQLDHDLCFKLRGRGYRLLQLKSVNFEHAVGYPVKYSLFGKTFVASNHPPMRRYYMTRNKLYLRKRFPDFYRPYFKMILMDVFVVVFFEGDKLNKMLAIIYGIVDFYKNRIGRNHRYAG